MARQCIFCSNPADSKEHVWPAWILRQLDIDRPMRHKLGRNPAKIVPKAELQVRCVCNTCNQGWMHDLEELNKPIIGKLLEGIAMSLDTTQQFTVARWAVKTSMIQDAMDTRNRQMFYTALEHTAIRSKSAIPENTAVWLGKYSLRTLSIDGYDVGLDFHDPDSKVPELVNGCVSTIVVGHLMLQVFTAHVPEKYSNRPFDVTCTVPGPWDRLLIPVWPVTVQVNWPPPLFLKGTGLDKLNGRLRGGISL
jgi:hypothetical protein